MVVNIGSMFITSIDAMNIPVNVFLSESCEADGELPGKFVLSADVFQPRRQSIVHSAIRCICDTREEAARLVSDLIEPLYRIAHARLERMISGEDDMLYYWEE